MSNVVSHILDFLSNYLLQERGLSKNTISSYSYSLYQWLFYLKEVKKIELEKLNTSQISKVDVIDFLNYLEIDKMVSASTRNSRLAALKSFSQYLEYRSLNHLGINYSISSIKFKKFETPKMIWLTKEEVDLILEQPLQGSRIEKKHFAILLFLVDTGVRVQELIDIKVKSIHFKTVAYVEVKGKGQKNRLVPLTTRLKNCLEQLIKNRERLHSNISDEKLFLNRSNKSFTRAGITYVVKKYVMEASKFKTSINPQKVGCHTFRHTKAMHLLDAGISLIEIKDILGHKNLSSTEIYLKSNEAKKISAMERSSTDLDLPKEEPQWVNQRNIFDILKSYR